MLIVLFDVQLSTDYMTCGGLFTMFPIYAAEPAACKEHSLFQILIVSTVVEDNLFYSQLFVIT